MALFLGCADYTPLRALDNESTRLDSHPNLAIIAGNRRAFPMAPTEESTLAEVDREAQAG